MHYHANLGLAISNPWLLGKSDSWGFRCHVFTFRESIKINVSIKMCNISSETGQMLYSSSHAGPQPLGGIFSEVTIK